VNHVLCDQCGHEFAMNDTIRLHGRPVCIQCAEKTLAGGVKVPKEAVEIQIDPTVCRNCGFDNGAVPLEKLAGLPACNPCIHAFRHRPFPGWIKGAAVSLILLVIFALWWNGRFYLAYGEMRAAFRAWGEGNVPSAAALMGRAADRVPENADLRAFADFFRGAELLQADKSAEAIECLQKCQSRIPPEAGVAELILHATMGKCYDEQDYDGFLKAAQEVDKRSPGRPMTRAGVASAYACKYAVTGDDAFKQKSLEALGQAKQMPADPERAEALAKYENRIRHRLATREIIRRQEFDRRFPEGWKEEKE